MSSPTIDLTPESPELLGSFPPGPWLSSSAASPALPSHVPIDALQQLLDQLPDGVALIDKDGLVLMTNTHWGAAATSTQVQPGERFQGVDELTGAATRRHFYDQAERTLEYARATQSAFSLIYLDIDDFKRVNDLYGHAVGDALLNLISTRLQSVLRQGDLLARFGGDEFVLLLQGVASTDAAQIAARFYQLLEAPFVIEGRELVIAASLGVASYPDQGGTIDDLLRQADAKMYRQKGVPQSAR